MKNKDILVTLWLHKILSLPHLNLLAWYDNLSLPTFKYTLASFNLIYFFLIFFKIDKIVQNIIWKNVYFKNFIYISITSIKFWNLIVNYILNHFINLKNVSESKTSNFEIWRKYIVACGSSFHVTDFSSTRNRLIYLND